MTDTRFRTADGVEITDGLWVWDNDLRLGTVDFAKSRPERETWDGWFYVRHATTGWSLVNGERMATRHPFTGEVAATRAATDTEG